MRKEERKQRRNNQLYQRMLDLGYDDVTEFKRESKIPLSFETCRRAIYNNRYNLRHDYLVVLMQFLDFTLDEIKKELKSRGDKHLHKLIIANSKGMRLNAQERSVIAGMRNHPDWASNILENYRIIYGKG